MVGLPVFSPLGTITVLMVTLAVAASPRLISGQPRAEIVGVVTSVPAGKALAGALLEIPGTNARALSDSAGNYRLRGVLAGDVVVEGKAIGFVSVSRAVSLAADSRVRLDFALQPLAVELPGITVNDAVLAAREARMRGFHQRRASGFGKFVTREDIERRDPRETRDLLRGVPGLRLVGDRVQMATGNSRGCVVQFFVDGIHAARPALEVLMQFQPRDLEGLEVYRGPAETPVEFSRGGAECGVIVIWTRLALRPER